MSLFPSAFDTSKPLPFAGAPFYGTSVNNPGKRKRPTTGGQRDDQLRSTQANLEKLMSRVEKGGLKSKREGREAMGLGSGAGGGKSQKKDKKGVVAERAGVHYGKERDARHGAGPKEGTKRKREEQNVSFPKGGQSKGFKPAKVASSSKTGRPAPAELSLPHTISPAKTSGASDDKSLTDLQKGMKVKLEGARFR
jgi:ribosomal RNA-processing protein 8